MYMHIYALMIFFFFQLLKKVSITNAKGREKSAVDNVTLIKGFKWSKCFPWILLLVFRDWFTLLWSSGTCCDGIAIRKILGRRWTSCAMLTTDCLFLLLFFHLFIIIIILKKVVSAFKKPEKIKQNDSFIPLKAFSNFTECIAACFFFFPATI